MDCSMPGFLILHYLPEFAQIHVQWIGDSIQPSHPLSSPSPPALNLSQRQGLFKWVGSFQMSWLFTSGGQSRVSASASALPMNIQGWFPLELTGLISLLSKGLSSFPAPQFESINFWHAAFFMVQRSHLYMATRNIIVLTICSFISKVMSLLFNMLSRIVIAFLPRRKSF